MTTVIDGLRQIIGTPSFVLDSGAWDYAAMIEYMVASIIVLVVVASVFRLLGKLVRS